MTTRDINAEDAEDFDAISRETSLNIDLVLFSVHSLFYN